MKRVGDLRDYKMTEEEKGIARDVQVELVKIWNLGLGFNSDDASKVTGDYEESHNMTIKFHIISYGGASGIKVMAKILDHNKSI